jgi:hypothetical protein
MTKGNHPRVEFATAVREIWQIILVSLWSMGQGDVEVVEHLKKIVNRVNKIGVGVEEKSFLVWGFQERMNFIPCMTGILPRGG